MKNERLVKLAAVCSFIGAVTTLVLVLIQVPAASTFDEKVMLHLNARYIGKLWIFFFHPQLNLIAALGVAALLYKRKPEFVLPALLFIGIWAITETAQHAFLIDAVNQYWREGYMKETNESVKLAYYNNLIGAEAIGDSMYFLLLYAYGIGSSFMGLALLTENLNENRTAIIPGIGFIFFGALSIIAFIDYYARVEALDPFVNFSFKWVYPFFQPVARGMLGVWLWKSAANRI
jgi:hypothetical protein